MMTLKKVLEKYRYLHHKDNSIMKVLNPYKWKTERSFCNYNENKHCKSIINFSFMVILEY